ncbi:hypothetical protein DU86_07160 [Methanosarcina mazei]|uniref:Uncharacterized protein n=1 Tax=Methanosarcina mazei TaxID=2209 RepID=A0A0F8KTA4_METMZ|nr:hypothetical protein DU40_07545 [Methanosarcina mazei]KKG01054.1 hypothetical protein DU31_05745 [Methanosarcina mazei]KKG17884.1 hypothetical protein DU34_09090 [Methanosarcina mazei]KKG28390.1 hypothetical protein DU49_10260 [Methanosarcina mazei]KKG39052.1 hypothetical protein DU39_10700 [Methanosarcina mazei]
MLVKIHLYHKSRQVSPFLLPEPHTLFSIKKYLILFSIVKPVFSNVFFSGCLFPSRQFDLFPKAFSEKFFRGDSEVPRPAEITFQELSVQSCFLFLP